MKIPNQSPLLRSLISNIFKPEWDLFAAYDNRLNQDIPYFSRFPEPDNSKNLNGLSYQGDQSIYAFPPVSIRDSALTVTKNVKKAIYIFTFKGHKTAEYYRFRMNNDIGIIIGTPTYPAVLRPSKKHYTTDGVTKRQELYRAVPHTIMFLRGYKQTQIECFKKGLLQMLPPETRDRFLSENGLATMN